ncbi:hypothetical protein L0128_18890 [candidate division KSB1 bacterium]|nr:hypothetical protein [candidate division KSB1 bacterium]
MNPLLSKINPPSLKYYNLPDEYRSYYLNKYVRRKIITFDNIEVKFTINQFNHAFYKASIPNVTYKDLFDRDRAERIDWIEYTLNSGYAEVYLKLDNRLRRLHILLDNYVVVINISMNNEKRAFFITAYLADTEQHIKLLKTNKLVYKPE